ncbi:MAG: hypothetical protein AB1599_01265 [Planctomycetota bacterium]
MVLKLPYKNAEEFDKDLSKITLANDGDGYERAFWPYINQRFPNYEKFWRKHIVPLTKRIELDRGHSERVRLRDNIPEKMGIISMVHYSVFINLIQAYKRLENPDLSYFEDFYTHLVSACDLAEDFWLKIYLLINECTGNQSKTMQQLTEDEFVKLAREFYNSDYRKIYEHYHKKGKRMPIYIPHIPDIVKEFFDGSNPNQQYKEYLEFSTGNKGIRQYRNKIVHNSQIGKIMVLVPKKEAISKYDTWWKVFNVQTEEEQLRADFIHPIEQMVTDIVKLETLFNNLWDVILQKMETLRSNRNYLKLQDIEFLDNYQDGNMAKQLDKPPDAPPIYQNYLGSGIGGIGSSVSPTSIPLSAMTEKDIIKKK